MKKSLFSAVLVFLFLLTGYDATTPNVPDGFPQSGNGPANIMFLSSMGCSDRNCTDVAHYHGCPADCTDYDHYHSCALDCSEVQHHHSETHHADNSHTSSPIASTVAFVSGMGCSDQTCTDMSHHHDCPADCADYDHYHSCTLDCSEAQHHHSSKIVDSGHSEHHEDKHH